jgi:hypothetical protein
MSEPKLKRRVNIGAMGVLYSETPDNVEVLGPDGSQSLDADHLDDKSWNDLKRAIETRQLDGAKVKKIIKAKQ